MTDQNPRSTEIVTDPVRVQFPSLFTPKPVMVGSDKVAYQATLLLPPDTNLDPYVEAVKAAMDDTFGKEIKLAGRTNPIKRCEDKLGTNGFEPGWFYMNVKSKFPPQIIDQKRQPVLAEDRIYAGVWCRFLLNAYGWKHASGNGVSFSLSACQLVKDDSPFQTRRDAAEVFGALEVPGNDVPAADPAHNSSANDIFG